MIDTRPLPNCAMLPLLKLTEFDAGPSSLATRPNNASPLPFEWLMTVMNLFRFSSKLIRLMVVNGPL